MPETRLLTLIAVPAAVVGLIVLAVLAVIGLPVWLAVLAGVLVAGLVGLVVHRASAQRVLNALHARPLELGTEPRLDNLLDALCANNGFDRPEVLSIDSAARNSAVLAAGGTTTLVVTDGLVHSLDYMGLEALLAHQLAAGDRPDLEYRTRVLGLLSLLPATLQQRLAHGLLEQPEVFTTDIDGAQLTRYPPGQVALLEALAAGDNRIGGVTDVSAGLWLVDPRGADAGADLHPALEDRIALLREL